MLTFNYIYIYIFKPRFFFFFILKTTDGYFKNWWWNFLLKYFTFPNVSNPFAQSILSSLKNRVLFNYCVLTLCLLLRSIHDCYYYYYFMQLTFLNVRRRVVRSNSIILQWKKIWERQFYFSSTRLKCVIHSLLLRLLYFVQTNE